MGAQTKQEEMMANIDNFTSPAQQRLNEIKEEQKALKREAKQLQQDEKDQAVVEEWEKVSTLKDELEQTVKDKLGMGWSLSRIGRKFQQHYTYQHPKNKRLKTSNNKEDWVVEYIKGGGNLTDLEETASKTILASARKAKDTWTGSVKAKGTSTVSGKTKKKATMKETRGKDTSSLMS
jgi:hypothetical protein